MEIEIYSMPLKIGRRKQRMERQHELRRWKTLHQERVKELWDSDGLIVFAGVVTIAIAVITGAICANNVSNLEWMYRWLKITISLSSIFVAGFSVGAFFNICVRIYALFTYPYPLPKLNFKQTYKFGNQNGPK